LKQDETLRSKKNRVGKVYLVGAGPGDPELISVKGSNLILDADCIIYDFLAPINLLKHRKDAELIYVGKTAGKHTVEQERINRLIVEKANEGKTVIRLKGGDPFIFGRGSEEAMVLVKEGIDFEIVPGISSAYGVPAYAGIPVTQRGKTSSVAFITGHEEPTKGKSDIAWDKISTGVGTLVFLMGVKNLSLIAKNLIKNGRDPQTDVAIIRWGTTSKQQTLTGKLADIAEKATEAGIKHPAVIVVGDVVSLREKLQWFEKKPLFGKTIIVTRTREQSSSLAVKLAHYGANLIEIPTIKTTIPDSFDSIDKAIKNLNEKKYQWVIFTSSNGVKYFLKRIEEKGYDSRLFAGTKIAVVGLATAKALKEYGLVADRIPKDFRGEGIVEALADIKGESILLARAEVAREVLPKNLVNNGNEVDIAVAYKTVVAEESKNVLIKAIENERIDLVTLTSSSTASNFSKLLEGIDKSGLKFASIGPVTTKTAKKLGFNVVTEAKESTIDGLVEEIVRY
jgi:uroporphyrinogen III methyltransferase/synthase